MDCATRDHSQVELEYRTRRPDGAERLISCTAHFFYDNDGRPLRGTGIATDVTDRRSLESQLRQAQKMEAVGQLAGGVAHDFNNLLTAILGYTELLTPHFRKDDKRLKDLEQIRKSATRATHLTRQLLAFSRRQILLPVVLDLNHVVNDLTTMLRRVISEDIDIDLQLDPAIGRVKVDQGQVEQVIMNLAVNARDAMPEGGSISIVTANVDVDDEFLRAKGVTLQTESRQFVMLSVADSGIGMDEATRCRIFEPFFTTKAKGKGTGLGLATVYGIVKQSGGFIWVYSEPGSGATFKVYLPRTDEALVQETAPTQAPAVRGNEVVLLVEDEEAVRMLARALLERYGYAVIEAGDAEHAMRLVHERDAAIDLLVSDVVMPGKSGPELYAALVPILPNLKVVYMSGYTDEAIVSRGILEAGTHFVQKPFTAAGLMLKVREALDEVAAS
jgi:signal transduction histidine kinase/ActR/RegA family two-component response regulator